MAEVSLSCPKCGSDNLITEDEPTDSSIVTCGDCGHEVCSWADYQATAFKGTFKSAEKDIKRLFGEAFKGNNDIKFTASSDESGDVEDK